MSTYGRSQIHSYRVADGIDLHSEQLFVSFRTLFAGGCADMIVGLIERGGQDLSDG